MADGGKGVEGRVARGVGAREQAKTVFVAGDEAPVVFGGHVAEAARVNDVARGLAVVRGSDPVPEGVVGVAPGVGRRGDADEAVLDVVGVDGRRGGFGLVRQIAIEVVTVFGGPDGSVLIQRVRGVSCGDAIVRDLSPELLT